jgi:predicted chitinase
MTTKFDRSSGYGGIAIDPAHPDLTRAELAAIYPGIAKDLREHRVTEAVVDAYVGWLNEAFRLLRIDTVQAQAGFLAHAAVESNQFRRMTETQGWRQDWVADPTAIRLDTKWLDEASANPRYPAYAMGGTINPMRDATWQSSYIGRGAVQVTHRQNYERVLSYLAEAASRAGAAGDAAGAARLARTAAAIRADVRQAANPEHAFLFSAAFMKEVEGDRTTAAVGPQAAFTGGGPESTWVTGGATELPEAATGKSAAWGRAYATLARRRAPASALGAQALEADLDEALADADTWQAHAQALRVQLAQALAALGDIRLPEPAVPSRSRPTLALLGSLYLVWELEPLLEASERLVALWASGAIQMHSARLEPALAKAWKERHLRLSGDERRHLLSVVFDPRECAPAMTRLCSALAALADNAQEHDVREEVGLQRAAEAVLELAATRLEGAPAVAAGDLVAQLREATQTLGDRTLQLAMGTHDLQGLARACLVGEPAEAASIGDRLDRARGGSVVLQWLATHAATGFAVDPRDPGLQAAIAAAQRWLLGAQSLAAAPAPVAPTIAAPAAAPQLPAW